jgi:hypothetical protein
VQQDAKTQYLFFVYLSPNTVKVQKAVDRSDNGWSRDIFCMKLLVLLYYEFRKDITAFSVTGSVLYVITNGWNLQFFVVIIKIFYYE